MLSGLNRIIYSETDVRFLPVPGRAETFHVVIRQHLPIISFQERMRVLSLPARHHHK